MMKMQTLINTMTVALAVYGVSITTTYATDANVLVNGDFEQGFHRESCGDVGNGWHCFTNGGQAEYGFYDEQWTPVVTDGDHGQLIEINTWDYEIPDHNRYAGIYQTVNVPAQSECTFIMKGMIRTTSDVVPDPWSYSVQIGISRGSEWTNVLNWVDTGWYTYYDRLEPGEFSSFTYTFTTESSSETIFIRFWKKWGVPEEEILLNLDSISLTCQVENAIPTTPPTPYYHCPVRIPYVGPTATSAPTARAMPYAMPTFTHMPYHTYTVQYGDTLMQIAWHSGVSINELIRLNGICNANHIYIGQVLLIPYK
ncbi:MAG: LysM domain-containing protein [Chloroflexota bacterium]